MSTVTNGSVDDGRADGGIGIVMDNGNGSFGGINGNNVSVDAHGETDERVDDSTLAVLVDIGFDPALAVEALRRGGGTVTGAIDWMERGREEREREASASGAGTARDDTFERRGSHGMMRSEDEGGGKHEDEYREASKGDGLVDRRAEDAEDKEMYHSLRDSGIGVVDLECIYSSASAAGYDESGGEGAPPSSYSETGAPVRPFGFTSVPSGLGPAAKAAGTSPAPEPELVPPTAPGSGRRTLSPPGPGRLEKIPAADGLPTPDGSGANSPKKPSERRTRARKNGGSKGVPAGRRSKSSAGGGDQSPPPGQQRPGQLETIPATDRLPRPDDGRMAGISIGRGGFDIPATAAMAATGISLASSSAPTANGAGGAPILAAGRINEGAVVGATLPSSPSSEQRAIEGFLAPPSSDAAATRGASAADGNAATGNVRRRLLESAVSAVDARAIPNEKEEEGGGWGRRFMCSRMCFLLLCAAIVAAAVGVTVPLVLKRGETTDEAKGAALEGVVSGSDGGSHDTSTLPPSSALPPESEIPATSTAVAGSAAPSATPTAESSAAPSSTPTAEASAAPSTSPAPSGLPTAPPTFAPVTSRLESFREALLDLSVSAEDDLADGTDSPQFRALRWIADEDGAALPTPEEVGGAADAARLVQRYSLAVLYFATGGEGWSNQTNFLSEDDECLWNYEGEGEGAFCSDGGTGAVSRLELGYNNASGTLPDEIGTLTGLEILNMEYNVLTGPLPSRLGDLVNLTELDLSENSLSGDLPSSIGRLSSIRSIDLSKNDFDIQLPTTLGNLTSLQSIDMSYNKIHGTLCTEIGRLKKLESLNLQGNDITGPLPTEIGQMEMLLDLVLVDNYITDDFARIFDIVRDIPLEYIEIGSNNITGTIPGAIGSMADSLWHLNLVNCRLSGAIPSSIGQLTNLRQLHLALNRLEGSIPESIGFVNITDVTLDGNYLTGSLPETMTSMEIYGLSLSQNLLSGSLPSWLPALADVDYLYLGGNMFNSSIPSGLFEHEYLESLSLEMNFLTGSLPSFGDHSLRELLLHSNRITGTLPSWLADSGYGDGLELVDVGNNYISGSLPPSFGHLQYLTYLHIARNNMTGSINFMCNTSITLLIADCGGLAPELECICCSSCCSDRQEDRQCDFHISGYSLGKTEGMFTGT